MNCPQVKIIHSEEAESVSTAVTISMSLTGQKHFRNPMEKYLWKKLLKYFFLGFSIFLIVLLVAKL